MFFQFLVADSQTRNSIRGLVRLSVNWSVRWSIMLELKTGKMCTYDAAVVIVCVSG